MKCDECKAYEMQADGHYECLASVPDEMIKTFSDGKCGCKYKSSTIDNLMEMATDSGDIAPGLDGQMDLSMFMSGGSIGGEMPQEEMAFEGVEENVVEEFSKLPEDHPELRSIFMPGELVKLANGSQTFKVKKQSKDRLVVYAENNQAGTVVLSTADLVSMVVADNPAIS